MLLLGRRLEHVPGLRREKSTATVVLDPDGYFAFPFINGKRPYLPLTGGRGPLGLTLHGDSTQGAGLFSIMPWSAEDMES